jgi:hypothetical protein
MSNLPLLYRDPMPLNKAVHAGLHLAPPASYRFADGVNAVPIAGVEFAPVAREYPIVFAEAEDRISPVALLGLQDRQNLYLAPDDSWRATYLPAYIRRYPFVLATGLAPEGLTICVDRAYEGLNGEGRGQRLFENGQESAYLQNVIGFLRDYQAQQQRTARLCERLQALELLESRQANVALEDGTRLTLRGFRVIDRARLTALGPEVVAELMHSDGLEWIYAHLLSLANLQVLVDRLAERRKAA